MPERDALRHELADHDVEVGDDEQGKDDGERRRDHRLEQVREQRLAHGADRQRGDRDAELHGRDEARRVARDPEDGSRPLVPLPLELADARPARGDEPVLSCHEERVEEDQARKSQQLEEKGHPSVARRAGS